MSQARITTVNLLKKASNRRIRSARIAFWRAESKTLRKKHKALLTGASLLTLALTLLHVLLSYEVWKLLAHANAPHAFRAAFITVSTVFGISLFSLLNIGGRRLTLLLYRNERWEHPDKINVGELFYPFGKKSDRKKCARLLRRIYKKLFITLSLIAASVFALAYFGRTAGLTVCIVSAMLLFLVSPQSRSLEWLFLIDSAGDKTLTPRKLSAYSMLSHEKDGRRITRIKRTRALLSLPLFIFGTPIFCLTALWTLDAVYAECVSSELQRSTVA